MTVLLSLAEEYPVNSMMEIEIEGASTMKGLIYCTDEISNTVVLQKSLLHTTLTSEIHILNAASIKSKKIIQHHKESILELPSNVNQKQLEEKEKKAIKLAQEALKHVNQKVRAHQMHNINILLLLQKEVLVLWTFDATVIIQSL